MDEGNDLSTIDVLLVEYACARSKVGILFEVLDNPISPGKLKQLPKKLRRGAQMLEFMVLLRENEWARALQALFAMVPKPLKRPAVRYELATLAFVQMWEDSEEEETIDMDFLFSCVPESNLDNGEVLKAKLQQTQMHLEAGKTSEDLFAQDTVMNFMEKICEVIRDVMALPSPPDTPTLETLVEQHQTPPIKVSKKNPKRCIDAPFSLGLDDPHDGPDDDAGLGLDVEDIENSSRSNFESPSVTKHLDRLGDQQKRIAATTDPLKQARKIARKAGKGSIINATPASRKRMAEAIDADEWDMPTPPATKRADQAALDVDVDDDDDLSPPPAKKKPSPKSGGGKRATYQRFSKEDVQKLIEGVQEVGAGKWEAIRSGYGLTHKTAMQLKDKWRNLEKTGKV